MLVVWRIALDNEHWAEQLWSRLDEADQAQANRFRYPELRRRYVIAHGALRTILAGEGRAAAKLRFIRNAWGKPALADQGGPVFNLSHAQEVALCAIASSGEIGVDVEAERPEGMVSRRELAKRFFSFDEYQILKKLEGEAFVSAFFQCWTRKEAYIKAKGLGLSLPLNQFTMQVDKQPKLITSDFCPDDVRCYRFWNVAVPSGYWGTLAYNGPVAGEFSCWDWHP